MFTLRKYQKDAVDAVISDMRNDGNSLVVLPTGAGKSIVIAEIANRINKPVLILSPSREILTQNRSKLLQYVPKHEVGIYSASFGLKQIRKYTFATIQSVHRKPELFQDFGLVLCDESHQVAVENPKTMFTKFFKALGKVKVIGFTASPFRNVTRYRHTKNGFGQKVLIAETHTQLINRIYPKFWGKIIYHINNAELIEQGFLSPLKYYDLSFYKQEDLKLNASRSEFDLEHFAKRLSVNQQKIMDYIVRCAKYYKSVLVFCSTVEEAYRLASSGLTNARYVDGTTKTEVREQILSDFKSGKTKVVFNVSVLGTGFDHPELDCIIILRPTKSLSLWYQFLGRGVRIAPGKTSCAVVDFTATYKSLGKIETIRIFKEKKLLDEFPQWYLETETGEFHNHLVSSYEKKAN